MQDAIAVLALWPDSCSLPPPPWPWESMGDDLQHTVQWMRTDLPESRVSAMQLLRRNGFEQYERALELAKTVCPTEQCLVKYVLENIQNISGAQVPSGPLAMLLCSGLSEAEESNGETSKGAHPPPQPIPFPNAFPMSRTSGWRFGARRRRADRFPGDSGCGGDATSGARQGAGARRGPVSSRAGKGGPADAAPVPCRSRRCTGESQRGEDGRGGWPGSCQSAAPRGSRPSVPSS